MNKQIIINVVKYEVRDKLESDNIRFRCHIMHNPCKAKKSNQRKIIKLKNKKQKNKINVYTYYRCAMIKIKIDLFLIFFKLTIFNACLMSIVNINCYSY